MTRFPVSHRAVLGAVSAAILLAPLALQAEEETTSDTTLPCQNIQNTMERRSCFLDHRIEQLREMHDERKTLREGQQTERHDLRKTQKTTRQATREECRLKVKDLTGEAKLKAWHDCLAGMKDLRGDQRDVRQTLRKEHRTERRDLRQTQRSVVRARFKAITEKVTARHAEVRKLIQSKFKDRFSRPKSSSSAASSVSSLSSSSVQSSAASSASSAADSASSASSAADSASSTSSAASSASSS